MVDHDAAQRVAAAAVKRACEFFGIPSDFAVSLVMTTDDEKANPASVFCRHDYLEYKVHINPQGYDSLAEVWRDAGGHEVGHLVMEEALSLCQILQDRNDRSAPHLLRALERGTMRLSGSSSGRTRTPATSTSRGVNSP